MQKNHVTTTSEQEAAMTISNPIWERVQLNFNIYLHYNFSRVA